MRGAVLSLVVATFLLLFPFVPGPISPTQSARAWHVGAVECYPGGDRIADGVIAPSEYGENYFDGRTKILVYLACDNSTQRLLHVGIVTPWSGWVGLLMQASDLSAGSLNEVRISYVPSSGGIRTVDAYRNMSAGLTTPDSVLGGTSDVMNATTGTMDAARVYEFSVPLRSDDRYDSQLQSSGPYYFALEYNATDSDLASEPTEISELHSIVVGSSGTPSTWTYVEFVLAPSLALGESNMLVALRDDKGYPIPSTQIEVFVLTAFGFFEAGPVVTNEQGVAEVSYVPRDAGSYLIGAAYTGGYGLLASVAWPVLQVGSPAQGGDLELGLVGGGAFELRPVEAIIVVVVMSVWATYAYAFFITRLAMREDRKGLVTRDTQALSSRSGK